MTCQMTLWLVVSSASAEATFTTLFSFRGTNGVNPEGKLVQGSDGSFYGTTRDTTATEGANYGFGSYGHGTVFRIAPTGKLTTLVTFTGTNGAYPRAGLVIGSDGSFYGTTAGGGTGHLGTVFRMSTNGALTSLASFDGTNGACPGAVLVEGRDGNFYGTAAFGGIRKRGVPATAVSGNGWFDYGAVFKISTKGTLTTLVLFRGTNGANPYKRLVRAIDGDFYGTTTMGGTNGFGTVFKMAASGELSTLLSFSGTNGTGPSELTVGNDGDLYGTTEIGGAMYDGTDLSGCGTVFRLNTRGILKSLVSFSGVNGKRPGALLLGLDGNFYGTTSEGGAFNNGTIFRMTPNGTLTTLYSFTEGGVAGIAPSLVQASDETFYGTTTAGGKHHCGSIFHLTVTTTPSTSTR